MRRMWAAPAAVVVCLALGGLPTLAQEASARPSASPLGSSSETLRPGTTLSTASVSLLPDSVRPAAGSLIAYVAGETGTSPAIHVVVADGSDDSFAAWGTLPTWAPDGNRIAYTCKPRRGDYFGSVCIRDLRSERDKVVIANGTLARWSPVGELIAFSRDVWALGDTWIYRPDPRATWQLPGGMAEWSPTGEWLRYETTRGEPERPVINIVHPDGSGARELGEGGTRRGHPMAVASR